MPQLDGVLVPPELARPLAAAARQGIASYDHRNGGGTVAAGLRELVDQLAAAVAPRRTPAVTVEARQLTTAQAAPVMGVTQRRVQQLARNGDIIAAKHGRDYLVDAQAAQQWKERRGLTAHGDHRSEGNGPGRP